MLGRKFSVPFRDKRGNKTTDAHLAALAIEHGVSLGPFDRDFDRFEGLSFERLKP
jgi:predicted nucleic acid-binding protein